MAKKRRSTITKILLAALILLGLGILLYVPITWLWSNIVQRNNPEDFARELSAASSVNQYVLSENPGLNETQQLLTLAEDYRSRLVGEQTIARMEIPTIGLSEILVEGTDEAAFRKGPGHLEETALPGMNGNFAIAGDRVLYGGPFLNLDDVRIDDEIIVHMPYGDFSYRVVRSYITLPDDMSVIQPAPGSDLITLITCDPLWDNSHRLVVQGKLVGSSLRAPESS